MRHPILADPLFDLRERGSEWRNCCGNGIRMCFFDMFLGDRMSSQTPLLSAGI